MSDRNTQRTQLRKFIGRSDLVLIAVLFLCACLLFAARAASVGRTDGGTLEITVNGETYGTYPLSEDRVIPIGETNVCEIRDGSARMTEADCPDQICVKSKAISKNGETIVCLPNRVILHVTGAGEDAGYDSIAG